MNITENTKLNIITLCENIMQDEESNFLENLEDYLDEYPLVPESERATRVGVCTVMKPVMECLTVDAMQEINSGSFAHEYVIAHDVLEELTK